MSELATASETSTPDPLFERAELEQFESDDREAGVAICKMLSLFFVYTIVVMSMAAIWTYASVSGDAPAPAETSAAHPH